MKYLKTYKLFENLPAPLGFHIVEEDGLMPEIVDIITDRLLELSDNYYSVYVSVYSEKKKDFLYISIANRSKDKEETNVPYPMNLRDIKTDEILDNIISMISELKMEKIKFVKSEIIFSHTADVIEITSVDDLERISELPSSTGEGIKNIALYFKL